MYPLNLVVQACEPLSQSSASLGSRVLKSKMERRRIITSLRSRSLRQMKNFEGQGSDKCHSTHKPFQMPK